MLVFLQCVEKIIVRDFFPDLPKLEAQNEYLEALQSNDVRKLREIHIKYGPKVPTSTPNICKSFCSSHNVHSFLKKYRK